jgi:hypothetical protein
MLQLHKIIKLSTSRLTLTSINNPTTTSLRSVRRSWANTTFVGSHTKVSGHEEDFLKFIQDVQMLDHDNKSD